MKKIFLIFALTTLVNIGANAEVNNTDIVIFRDREWTNGVEIEENNIQQEGVSTAPQSNLEKSFIRAFLGTEVDVDAGGGSGDAGPSMDGSSSGGGTAAIGTSTISTTSANQVTPSFTPYRNQ